MAQAKLITKPVTIELFWFRFNVDVNDKIDALQKWAHDPPTSADDVPDMILELCGDDEIMFCPNFPILGRVEITVGVDQLAALVKKALVGGFHDLGGVDSGRDCYRHGFIHSGNGLSVLPN